LAAEHLGGTALGELTIERGADCRLVLGLGAGVETIRAEGPRLAAAILSELSQGHV
jgi:hypothetical protein